MITLPITEALLVWDRLWNMTKDEWFKVEVLQDYTGEDSGPSLNSWLKGDEKKSIEILTSDASNNEWIRECQRANFKRIRIHIVSKPYTKYLEWELSCYKHLNIPLCGEDVYLVDGIQVEDLKIPKGDFVIFDMKSVVQNHYDHLGKAIKMDFYTSPDDITYYLNLREKLLTKSIKL